MVKWTPPKKKPYLPPKKHEKTGKMTKFKERQVRNEVSNELYLIIFVLNMFLTISTLSFVAAVFLEDILFPV